LSLLAQEHPQLRVEITQREPESALDEVWARTFDLVIAEEYPAHSAPLRRDLDRVALVHDGLRLGVPPVGVRHDAGRGDGGPSIRSIHDASRMAWVMEPRGTASRHWAEQQCRLAGFEPDVRFETADLQAHIRLVETGHAVALLPDLVWAGAEPRVPLVTLDGDPHRSVFTAARVSSAARPAIVAVRETLSRAVGSLI
jgi:DNA-binding transcriptional LysR family regulator